MTAFPRSRPLFRLAGLGRCSLTCLLAVFPLSFAPLPFAASALHAAEEQGEKPLSLSLSAAPPTIDGTLQPGEWEKATPLGRFTPRLKGEFPETEAWVTSNGTSLLIAVRCGEPTPDKIRTVTIADEKNSTVDEDDHVHVVLDMGNTGKQELYDLLVNAEGTIAHARSFGIRHLPGAWESGARVRTHVGKESWEVEIEIPLQALGHVIQPGEHLGINISRTRFAGQTKPTQASLRNPFSVHVKKLIPLVAANTPEGGALGFQSLARGPFCSWEDGEWRFRIAPANAAELVIRWPNEEANGVKGSMERRPLVPGEQIVSLPFPARQANARRRIELSLASRPGGEPDKPFYISEHALTDDSNQLSIPETKDPLFEEVITHRPDGLSKDGYIVWRHALQGSAKMSRTHFARKSGDTYSEEEVFRQWGKEGAIVMSNTPRQLSPETLARAERNGVKFVVYPLFRGSAEDGAPLMGSQPWMLDPRSEESYLKDVQKIIDLAKENPCIWGIAAGDEAFEVARTGLRYAIVGRHEKHYPEFEAADADVKSRFGYGRYGFPLSITDTNPFRWLATARWEIDRMFAIQKKVKAMIDEQCPRLRLVSWDPQTSVHARDYQRWGALFDVVTGQVSSNFGFYAKVTADLNRANETWLCTHIEHYLGNYNAREIEELLSDVFRHGITGLHLYTSNVIKSRIGAGDPLVDRIGAPERWSAVTQIINRLRKEPFRVEQKASNTAVFVSTSSLLSQGSTNPKVDDLQALYEILGPKLHQGFTFIDEGAFTPERVAALSRYQTIWLTSAPIVDDDIYAALEHYVEEGGRLIVCDPLAFGYRSDGTAREKGLLLPPLVDRKAAPLPGKRLQTSLIRDNLEPLGLFYVLSAGKAKQADAQPAKILASTKEGQPGMLSRRVGKGEVEFWAQNPFGPTMPKSEAWVHLVAAIQKQGHAVESPIWRFRFPPTTPYVAPHPEGQCVTGNFLEWRQSEPRLINNASDVQGTVWLSAPPLRDAEPAEEEIPISRSRLHDRYAGAISASTADPYHFMLSWQNPGELIIRYHFTRPVKANLVRLFAQGNLPAGVVETSADGQEWREAGHWEEAKIAKDDVAKTSIALPAGEAAQYLRLRFAEGHSFALSEIDIWESANQ